MRHIRETLRTMDLISSLLSESVAREVYVAAATSHATERKESDSASEAVRRAPAQADRVGEGRMPRHAVTNTQTNTQTNNQASETNINSKLPGKKASHEQ